MEVRQLTTDQELRTFAERVSQARATRGLGFVDNSMPRLQKHLRLGIAYGIFETDDGAQDMVAGFIMHDLLSLPQSFSKPDLSRLPPESVIEGGTLWSLSRGAAGVARQIAPVIVGILQAKAVLLYPVCRPVDLTAPHRELGFVDASEPIPNQFARTFGGERLWVQPLILQEERLQAYVRWGFDCLFRNEEGRQVFQLGTPRRAIRMPVPVQMDETEFGAERMSVPAV